MNEFLLILSGLISAGLVVAAWRLDKERLFSIIVIFLILISITGGKIVEFFGHETNTGNVFYAAVFLATYFLIERYGKREGIRSIWIGVAGVLTFSALLVITVLYTSVATTAPLSTALESASASLSRLALASLIAYVASQALNVYLFIRLKEYFSGARLWLRANIANGVAQVLDSALFFTIAFMGVVPPENIWDVMLTGLVIKVVFMMFAAPLLTLNHVQEDEESGYTTMRLG